MRFYWDTNPVDGEDERQEIETRRALEAWRAAEQLSDEFSDDPDLDGICDLPARGGKAPLYLTCWRMLRQRRENGE
ncbi:MAG: hypothetical protein V8Q43_03905 [Christensenellaceae bacterium]